MAFLDRSELSVAATLGLTDEILAWQSSNVGKTATLQRLLNEIGIWRMLSHSSAIVSHTGDTTLTQLVSVVLPAGSMGPNGRLRVTHAWSGIGAAGAKQVQVRLGASTVLDLQLSATSIGYRGMHSIANRNNQAIQVTSPALTTPNSFAQTTTSLNALTVDTSAASTVEFWGKVFTSSETISLEDYTIELLYGA